MAQACRVGGALICDGEEETHTELASFLCRKGFGVDAAVEHIQAVWEPTPAPAWVTAVPSRNDDEHVTDLARRIAAGLEVPYEPALRKVKSTDPQHELANSYQKRWNVEDAFEATAGVRSDPVLLVDETVNSRWTLTEAGLTLRDGGSGVVYPFALAERSKW